MYFHIKMGLKAILIFLIVTYGFCVTFGCCSKMTVKKENRARDKRNIPYAGQTLQATYNILSHPIVAAALQKISMDAMATVASALKEVHQSEENEKKKKLMTKTLDKISKINLVSLRQPMPLLHDFDDGSGSGELEAEESEISGSGNEANDVVSNFKVHNATIKRSKVKNSAKHHRRHYHHHHHHHRHLHHKKHEKANKKSSTIKDENNHKETELALKHINWEFIANNTSIVEKIAKDSHIPVKDLLQILHNGASRSDITKQAAALLNKSIETQNDLSRIYSAEEKKPEDEDKELIISKNVSLPVQQKVEKVPVKTQPVKQIAKTVTNKTTALVIPKNIPDKCSSLVKQYSDGEMILMDYLKQMKICKKGEEVAKKLANTTPLQRVAIATQDLIQQQAYMYALNSMRNSKPTTVKEAATAEGIMDKWRSNSFGPKIAPPSKSNVIPNTIKLFMTQQTPTNVASKTSSLLSVNTVVSKENSKVSTFEKTKQDVKYNDKPETTKRKTVPENLALFHKINLLNGETDQSLPQTGHEPLVNLQKNIPGLSTGSLISNPNFKNQNVELFNRFGFLEKKSYIPVGNPTTLKIFSPQLFHETLPQQNLAQRSVIKGTSNNEILTQASSIFSNVNSDPNSLLQSPKNIFSNLAEPKVEVETVKNYFPQSQLYKTELPSVISSAMPNAMLINKEIEKEQFLASLANPAFHDIPVDGTLTAAIERMSNINMPMDDTNKNIELQKRDITNIAEKDNKKDPILKVQSDKAIERSKMSVPLAESQQGPKLMDKIRDIGRIIATP